MSFLEPADPEAGRILDEEKRRQQETVNLIASENHASPAVLEAQGSFVSGKYAEGYPRQRYYGGCVGADNIEELAIRRACELFRADHANVQAHSGSQANMAAYFTLLGHGDTVLAMNLAHGGHLTHGAPVSFSGRLYNFVPYGVDRETERIDYPEIEKLALSHRPKLIVAGASAYPRIIDFERLRFIADKVGARLMVDMAHIAGLVAAGLHPTPVPYADIVTSTTHKTLRGPRGGFLLCRKELASALDAAVFPEMQGGPFVHVILAKAISFYEAMQPEFNDYQQAILDNTLTLAVELEQAGLRLVSGGTDNHLVLVDLRDTGVSGWQAQESLEAAGIVANRNSIPFDPGSKRSPGGIRFGAAAVTTRGFGPEEMKRLAALIVRVIKNTADPAVREQVNREAKEICRRFPIPGLAD